MFLKSKLLPVIALFAFSGYIAAQTSSLPPATGQPAPERAAVTTAELLMPQSLLVRRVLTGLNPRSKPSLYTTSFAPYRPLSTMMMFSGSENFVAKFTDSSGDLGNSDIFDNGGLVGIGTSSPQATLHVAGDNSPGVLIEAQDAIQFGTTTCCGAGPTGSSLGSSAGWSTFL